MKTSLPAGTTKLPIVIVTVFGSLTDASTEPDPPPAAPEPLPEFVVPFAEPPVPLAEPPVPLEPAPPLAPGDDEPPALSLEPPAPGSDPDADPVEPLPPDPPVPQERPKTAAIKATTRHVCISFQLLSEPRARVPHQ
jgi:hypothetical protein